MPGGRVVCVTSMDGLSFWTLGGRKLGRITSPIDERTFGLAADALFGGDPSGWLVRWPLRVVASGNDLAAVQRHIQELVMETA